MKHAFIKKAIHAENCLNEPIQYGKSFSRGIRIKLGRAVLLFISGTASIDRKGNTYRPRNFSEQIKRTFYNLTALLESEGANWHDVVRTICYLKKMKYYKEFNKFRNRFYKEQGLNPFPASTCVEANLCRTNLLVEIELTAIFKAKK